MSQKLSKDLSREAEENMKSAEKSGKMTSIPITVVKTSQKEMKTGSGMPSSQLLTGDSTELKPPKKLPAPPSRPVGPPKIEMRSVRVAVQRQQSVTSFTTEDLDIFTGGE